jgi:hypothetical protein
VLALLAVIGLAAGDCRAETITLTVSWNGNTFTAMGTSGVFVGPGSGPAGAQTVLNINVGALNSDLAAGGSAYTFSDLGVTTNFPGTNSSEGAFLQISGLLDVATTGTAGDIKVFSSEGGFTAPPSSSTKLTLADTANYTGTTSTSTQTGTGGFSDSSSPAVTAGVGPIALSSNGTTTDSHEGSTPPLTLPTYVTPFTLTNTLDFNLTPRGTSSGSDGFSGQTSVVSGSIPEPASVLLLLTGILPVFVVLRRRRGLVAG